MTGDPSAYILVYHELKINSGNLLVSISMFAGSTTTFPKNITLSQVHFTSSGNISNLQNMVAMGSTLTFMSPTSLSSVEFILCNVGVFQVFFRFIC